MIIKSLNFADKPTMDLNNKTMSDILETVKPSQPPLKRYGVKIDKNNSDPEARIEYMYDAVGFTPAHMNYATGAFDYGSWGDVWFIKENYPVMLYSSGEVAYKLDPNDYSKKEDGTTSEYTTGGSFDGNAMSRIPLIWVSMTEDDNYEYISVCEEKYDETYHAMAHTREDGSIVDEIFLSMFKSRLVNNKLRSISADYPTMENSGTNEILYATNNGNGWYIRTWGQRQLINALLTIIGKSDDTQEVFGTGVTNTYVNSSTAHYGMLQSGKRSFNTGQFYGTNDNVNHVKVFHIEDWWGNQWERIAGLLLSHSNVKVSLTGPYNTTGEGYDIVPNSISGSSGGYISKVSTSKYGRIPYSTQNGSKSTYLCDHFYFTSSSSKFYCAAVGNDCSAINGSGAHAIYALSDVSQSDWKYGSCLSFMKPV